ncbi:MAG: GGDEF domain-containing protein, partial [Treponema sp.]|nr:GGDEF domain-containing protein [Treponema sp.]
HAAGDMALVLIADVIMGCVDGRKGDRVVRFGGDEFLVFLRSPDVESLRRSVWDMVSAVSYIKVESFPEMVLSISVGGAFNSGGGEYLSLMKRADENLYTVKGHGRNGGLVS